MLAGCHVSAAKYYIKGQYYLQSGNTKNGVAYFDAALEKSPDDPWANYYAGRCLLIEKQPGKALARLKQSARLNPQNADFNFWLGVAHAANHDFKSEQQAYENALRLQPDHLQALIYLGHNLFNANRYEAALKQYDAAIRRWPECPSALYNRAIILNKLGRTPEEKKAWLTYLKHYSTGAFARNAVSHLNTHGDFTYRNVIIGAQTLTIQAITFDKNQSLDKQSKQHLDRIARVLKTNKTIHIHAVVYQKGNKTLAHDKAKAIKSYMVERYSEITPGRIMLSWFDTPEIIRVNQKTIELAESVKFITAH